MLKIKEKVDSKYLKKYADPKQMTKEEELIFKRKSFFDFVYENGLILSINGLERSLIDSGADKNFVKFLKQILSDKQVVVWFEKFKRGEVD